MFPLFSQIYLWIFSRITFMLIWRLSLDATVFPDLQKLFIDVKQMLLSEKEFNE